MYHLVKILIFVSCSSAVWGQLPANEPTDYLYKKNWYVGGQLATNGFGLLFSYERNLTFRFKQGLHFSMAGIKNGNETRRTNAAYENSRSYVFGKINLLFSARLAYGSSWLLVERQRIRGVAIRFNTHFGPTLGITKPIYLKIKEPYNQVPETEAKDLLYDPTIHNNENIYGRSNIWRGLRGSQFVLGAFVKTGFQFDFSPNTAKITAVEVGLQLDYFTKKIDLFYTGNNKQLFPSLFAAVHLGKNKIE